MKKKLLKCLTAIVATTVIGGTIPTTMAYALNKSDFENKIDSKIDKMKITNNSSESSFDKIINDIKDKYDDFDNYDVDIEDFDKDKATREDNGKITFTINVNNYDKDKKDNDKDAGTFDISVEIPKIGTYVYAKLSELPNKYVKVTDSSITNKAIDENLDNSKYLVSNEELESDKVISTGWQTIDNATYYIDSKYVITKGWAETNSKLYHFDETTGKLKTGWTLYNGSWYFMNISNNKDENGEVLTGFKIIDNVNYYFIPKQNNGNITTTIALPNYGAMVTGWLEIGKTWYFFNGSGAMLKGWQQIGGVWYYFNTDNGAMACNTTIGGYKLNANGAWIY